MTSIQGCSHFRQGHLFIVLFDSFSPSQWDDKLSDQPAKLPEANLFLAIILATLFFVSKYIKKKIYSGFLRPFWRLNLFPPLRSSKTNS